MATLAFNELTKSYLVLLSADDLYTASCFVTYKILKCFQQILKISF